MIGAGGAIPWRIPGEQRRFKEMTMGKPMIMGRKTFEVLQKMGGGSFGSGVKYYVFSRTLSAGEYQGVEITRQSPTAQVETGSFGAQPPT